MDIRPLSSTCALAQSFSSPGKLYTACHRITQELVVLQVFDRQLLRQRNVRRRLRQELHVLNRVKGQPNLLQVAEVTAIGTTVTVTFERVSGDQVLKKVSSERDVSDVLQQVGRGLQGLHEKGVVHGQVWPEHLVFSDDELDAHVLLVAFGRAAPWRSLTLRCCSKTRNGFLWDDRHHIWFLPPFLLRRKNKRLQKGLLDKDDEGKKLVRNWKEAQQIDIWALGVTLYVMLCGCLPFVSADAHNDSLADIERRIIQDKLTFPASGALLSLAAKDLLHRLLTKNVDAAMNISDVIAHPWLNGAVAPAIRWSAEVLTQHNVFRMWYAEQVAAVASRPLVSTTEISHVSNVDNMEANALASEVSTLTSREKARSIVDGAVLQCGTLEMEAHEEKKACPPFMIAHGTQLLLNDEVQQERPSADCYMRLASLEIGGQDINTNIDDEGVVADSDISTRRDVVPGSRPTVDVGSDGYHITREKSLDKLWQVLLRRRRFISKSLSSSSGNDRSETVLGKTGSYSQT